MLKFQRLKVREISIVFYNANESDTGFAQIRDVMRVINQFKDKKNPWQ